MKIKVYIFLLVLLTNLTVFGGNPFDISFSLVAQKNQVELGEKVLVSMRLSFPESINKNMVVFPTILNPKALNDTVEIITVNPETSGIEKDNQGKSFFVWQQDFEIALFAGGKISLPAFKAILGNDTVATNILSFTVNTPDVNMEDGIMAMKDIEEDPYTFGEKVTRFLLGYWWALALLLIAIFVWIVYKRRLHAKRNPVVDQGPKIPLEEQLLIRLEAIEKEELWQNNKHKAYYSEITAVIRKYLEHKYAIATFEKTSNEMLEQLKLSAINKADYQQLANLFELADLIKFAKSLPSATENNQAMSISKKLIKRAIEVRDKKLSKSSHHE